MGSLRRLLAIAGLAVAASTGCSSVPPGGDFVLAEPPKNKDAKSEGPGDETSGVASPPPTSGPVPETDGDAPPASLPAPSGSLRVFTFNIAHGGVVSLDLSKIATEIKAADPDVVGLQQVDEKTNRSGGKSQTHELAILIGMEHEYFASAFDYDGGKFGVAILSKYPLERARVIRLDERTTYDGTKEPQVAAAADVMKGVAIPFATLQGSPDAAERTKNAKALVAGFGADAPRGFVCGYFNEPPGGAIGAPIGAAGMIDTFGERHPESKGYTYPAATPSVRTSFVFRGKMLGATEHAWVPPVQVSTHRPVGAVVPLK